MYRELSVLDDAADEELAGELVGRAAVDDVDVVDALAGGGAIELDAPVRKCLREAAARLQGEPDPRVGVVAEKRLLGIVEHRVSRYPLPIDRQPPVQLHAAERAPAAAFEALAGPGLEAIEAIEAQKALLGQIEPDAGDLEELVPPALRSRPPCVKENAETRRSHAYRSLSG